LENTLIYIGMVKNKACCPQKNRWQPPLYVIPPMKHKVVPTAFSPSSVFS